MKRIIIALALASFTGGAFADGKVERCDDCGTVRAVDLMHNGGVVGPLAGKNRNSPGAVYRITVDMDIGPTRSVNVADAAGLRNGDRVRVVGPDIEQIE